MLRVLSGSLFLLVAFVARLPASPPQEPQVTISFTNAPLAEVLKLYKDLKDKRVMVSEPLRQKLVSINSEELVTRGEAIKLIESSLLDDYGIRIERSGAIWLHVLGPNEEGGYKTHLLPLVPETVIVCPPRRPHSQEIPTGGLSGETGGQSGAPLKETLDAKLKLSAAYEDFQYAEAMLREGRRKEAKEAFGRVLRQLDQIKAQAPNWEPRMVDFRLKRTREYLDSLSDEQP